MENLTRAREGQPYNPTAISAMATKRYSMKQVQAIFGDLVPIVAMVVNKSIVH